MRLFLRLGCGVTPLIRAGKGKSSIIRRSTFKDEARMVAVGGRGGDGCVSFSRLWVNDMNGPDGGDGGNGGHVIFQTSNDVTSLSNIPSIMRGKSGVAGGQDNCHGKNAPPTVVKVPEGTLIRDPKDRTLLVDLFSSSFLAARGGSGGRGNKFFATAVNQSPRICEYGSEGESCEYLLEMAVIAHVGLVGYPNAGKSTLLSAMTRARPKVASYPFTTLSPNVGIIPYDDYSQIRIADIPGLIEGAWQNKGLGHSFLRHIQRCVCLVYVIDLTWNPKQQLETLRNELKAYDPGLLDKPSLVVGNKIDLEDAQRNSQDVHTDINISGKFSTNMKMLLQLIRRFYDENSTKSNAITT